MKYLICCLFFVVLHGVNAQVCTGDFVFSTQQDMDDFLSNNPACTSIDGDVTINLGVIGDPILDLFALQNITSISGSLYLSDQGGIIAADLSGLSNLTTIGDELNFYAFAGDISPLQNLQNVGSINIDATWHQDLQIFDNITTLENLTIDLASFLGISEGADLYNIFPNLTTVNNALTIGLTESSCDTLTGFNSLVSVGSLYIGYDLLYMNHFDAMHNLQQVGVFYNYNWIINSISGFESVQSIDYLEMAIACDCDLPDFESLENAQTMYIANYAITQPDFPSLNHVNGNIMVLGDANELGFVNLKIVEGNLDISPEDISDYSLFSEIHLDSLQKVYGNFSIVGTSIDNIEFLSQLDSVGGTMYLEGNFNLSNCEIDYFCQQIPIAPEMFFISNNAGCASPAEVLASCGESYVAGLVYYDLDCDGSFNNDDVAVANPLIHNENNLPVSGSDSMGNYFVPLSDNSTSTFSVAGMPLFATSTQTITTGTFTEAFENVDFPLCPIENLHDIGISSYITSSFTPGFNTIMYFHVRNYSIYSEEVRLVLNLDHMPGISLVSISNDGIHDGDSIVWNLNNIPPLGIGLAYVQLHLDPTTPLGEILNSSFVATLLPSSLVDIDMSNNSNSNSFTVVGSYDPNDITVNIPTYDYDLLEENQGIYLDYTIRFQNTGTAHAINVRVDDIIEEDLDLSTFQMLDASHTYQLSFGESRKVEWLFENILLPDSFSNEPASHGFIHFRIKTKNNLQLTDVIENSVAIYFDFNEPVITNTATTIFYECTQMIDLVEAIQVCEGEVVEIPTQSNFSVYAWTLNDEPISAGNTATLSDLIPNTYIVSVTGIDTYCEAWDQMTIIVVALPDAPVLTASNKTITATGNGVFTWTLNGEVLAETGNSINITESGVYGASVVTNGCSSEFGTGSFIYTGVGDVNLDAQLFYYPNPASDWLNVEWKGSRTQFVLSDATGRIVLHTSVISGMNVIDISAIQSGVYYLTILDDKDCVILNSNICIQ